MINACTTVGVFVITPWGISPLQSDRSLSRDYGLDYASECENNNNNNNNNNNDDDDDDDDDDETAATPRAKHRSGSAQQLIDSLRRMDNRPYPAYKDIEGSWTFSGQQVRGCCDWSTRCVGMAAGFSPFCSASLVQNPILQVGASHPPFFAPRLRGRAVVWGGLTRELSAYRRIPSRLKSIGDRALAVRSRAARFRAGLSAWSERRILAREQKPRGSDLRSPALP